MDKRSEIDSERSSSDDPPTVSEWRDLYRRALTTLSDNPECQWPKGCDTDMLTRVLVFTADGSELSLCVNHAVDGIQAGAYVSLTTIGGPLTDVPDA